MRNGERRNMVTISVFYIRTRMCVYATFFLLTVQRRNMNVYMMNIYTSRFFLSFFSNNYSMMMMTMMMMRIRIRRVTVLVVMTIEIRANCAFCPCATSLIVWTNKAPCTSRWIYIYVCVYVSVARGRSLAFIKPFRI